MNSAVNIQNLGSTNLLDRGSSGIRRENLPVQYDTVSVSSGSEDIDKMSLLEKAKNLKAQLLAGKTTPSPYKGTAEEQLTRNENFISGVNNAKGNTLNEIKENTDKKVEAYTIANTGAQLVTSAGLLVATIAGVAAVGSMAFGTLGEVMEAFHLAAQTGSSASLMDFSTTAFKVAVGAGLTGVAGYGLTAVTDKMSQIYKSFSGKLQDWKDHLFGPKEPTAGQTPQNEAALDYQI